MKKSFFSSLNTIFTLSFFLFFLSSCSPPANQNQLTSPEVDNKQTSSNPVSENLSLGDTEWTYNKNITTPIVAKSSNTDLVLGDINQDKITISVPKGTFDTETNIELKTPDNVPKYLGQEIKMLGAPIEIKAGEISRLNEPVIINFKYDQAEIDPARGIASIRVAYYDGSKWAYIKPDAIDQANQLITFTTYHFSLFGANQIKDDTVITETWIHSQTLDKQMKDNLNKVSDHVAEQIIDLTLEKMGISDKTLKGKVLADVLKDDGYKGIYNAYKEGDVVDLNQKIALLAGKKIAQIADESVLQAGLSNLTEGSDDIAAVSKAAGYIAGGQYKDAAKIIGEQIADKFIITAAGKIAVEVVDYQIESWKNNEVEAAYTAFRDGANAKFYGYNNDKEDFDTVWSQMRGISRQLCLEAIKKENAVRSESGLPSLNEKQMDRIRDSVKESYRKQFTLRAEKEEELKKEEAKLRLLVDSFKRNNLFDTTTGPAGLDKGLDYENKLNVLYHFTQKMMKDTKRFDLSDKNGLIMDKAIAVDDIANGARLYFSVPDGKKQYAKFLKDRFNIDLSPALKDLAGNWASGKLLVKDVILSPANIAKIEASKNQPKDTEGGCDFTLDLRELKGKEAPLTLDIVATNDTAGTIKLNFDGSAVDPLPFTYEGGEISGSLSKDGATGTLNLSISEETDGFSASGPFIIVFGEGEKLIIDINAKKVINKPAQSTKK